MLQVLARVMNLGYFWGGGYYFDMMRRSERNLGLRLWTRMDLRLRTEVDIRLRTRVDLRFHCLVI